MHWEAKMVRIKWESSLVDMPSLDSGFERAGAAHT